MPEGDTVATAALRLRPLLEGQILRAAASRWPGVVVGLEGRTVEGLRTRGKHLLIDLDDGTLLRVHLGMKGTWHRYGVDEGYRGSLGSVSVLLQTDEHVVVCLLAPTVERMDLRAEASHPVLSRLGPDLLQPVDLDEVVARARARGGPLGEVLLDQTVACGLGNVYKCELAFLFGLDPFADVGDVDPGVLGDLYRRGAALLAANVGRLRDTTGLGPGRPSTWVYGRAGRPCLRCGGRIARRTTGRDLPRITDWCPRCQRTAGR